MLIRIFNKKSLEKKPINGGTPAKEKIITVKKNKKKLSKLKSEREYNVFISTLINEKKTQNKLIIDRL